MIFIDRSATRVPAVLLSERARKAYDEIALAVARTQRRAPIDPSLFANEDVRGALRDEFYGKCGYCESQVATIDSGDVDHFRPRDAAADERGRSSLHYYAWLSYEWLNLIYACPACRSSKENSFPVRGERAPPLATLAETRNAEDPALIDPTLEQSFGHLHFVADGSCIPISWRGAVTIKVLRLNREDLVRERHARLHGFRTVVLRVAGDRDAPESFDDFLGPAAPYAGAVRALAARLVNNLNALQLTPERAQKALVRRLRRSSQQRCLEAFAEIDRETPPKSVATDTPAARSQAAKRPVEMTPSIHSVEIENFKAIERLSFQFTDRRKRTDDASCLMLLGENATGKSTVLEAIALALVGADEANKLKLTPSDFLRRADRTKWKLTNALPAKIRVHFHDRSAPAEITILPGEERFIGHSRAPFNVMGYGSRRYFLEGKTQRGPGAQSRVRALFDPGYSLPHPKIWLSMLKDPVFDAVARALSEVLALRAEDQLIRDPELGICVSANGQLTPVNRLSDGYKSLFAMAVDVMRGMLDAADNLEHARGVVLIDEIETHLHPQWKMRVMSALRRAMPRVQFIVTTHDPLCLRGMSDGEVVVLNRDENQHIDQLLDLPNVTGLRAEQLLTSDYFGLNSTAEPDIEISIARLADSLTGQGDSSVPEELAVQLSKTIVTGEGSVDQLMSDAVNEYLRDRRNSAPEQRVVKRRKAVSALVSAIAARDKTSSGT